MAQSLKSKSAKGFAWNFGGNLLRQGSFFIISIFLARILSPAEFGLVGMAMVFIAISQVFIDVGFASALIHRQDNTNLTYSSVFYLNAALGLILTGLFYFAAPLVGRFYDNPEVTELVRWLSLIFIFNSLDIVQMTILKKELNFKVLTVRTFAATVIGGILGIIGALFGMGVYSLVLMNLTTAVIGTILLWTTSSWKPNLQFSMKEVKKLTGFSSYMFLDRIFSSISQRLDVLFVGKIFNPNTLGFYSRATSLRDIVTSYSSSSFTAVFFPVLSTLQKDTKEYERVYFKVISIIAFVSYALTGLLCIMGQDVILLLFGSKWLPSVVIFQVLILMACNTPINSMMVNAFLSKGKSKENFWIGIIRKIIRLLPLGIMYYYGMLSFTIAYVVVSYLITLMNVLFLEKYLGLSFKRHVLEIFEGMIPLGLSLALFFYYDPKLIIERIGFASLFIILYLLYSKLRKSSGLFLIIDNLSLIKSKLKEKINKN